jgi:hypothetical protein
VSATATPANGTLTQNTDDHPKKVSRTPPITGPTPKPVPPMAAQVPMAPARAGAGNVSVMIDSVRASMAAPPTPCRARKPMSAASLRDRAQATEPAAKIVTPIRKIRLRP